MGDGGLVILVAVLVLGFGLVSRVLSRGVVTGPMVFLGVGVAVGLWLIGGDGVGAGDGHSGGGDGHGGLGGVVHTLGEFTLIVLLFTDAARIDVRALVREGGLAARMLGIGMPLSILLGALVGMVLFPGMGVWELLVLGAVLAPTDAALGQAVVTSERVPGRIRQTLSVESGLNDGIAVPLVVVFASLASIGQPVAGGGAAGDGVTMSAAECVAFALKQVTLGPVVGVGVGLAGALLLGVSIRRGWIAHEYLELAGIAVAVLAALGAKAVGGNAFIAAFAAGLAFGNATACPVGVLYDFAEAEGTLLMLVTFLITGMALIPDVLRDMSWEVLMYAALSLTAVRMIPVSLSLFGTRSSFGTHVFLGWFGPRGIASVLFAVLLLEPGAGLAFPGSEMVAGIAFATVAMSVVLHGASAAPGVGAYARSLERVRCATALREVGTACYRTKRSGGGDSTTAPTRSDET